MSFGQTRIKILGASTRLAFATAALVAILTTPAGADAQSDAVTDALNWKGMFVPNPTMSVSPCRTPPTIDGKLEPGEWNDACAISTLSAHGAAYAYPTALVYVTYDANRLYFGYLRHKASPEWFTAKNRFRDSATYTEPHLELFLSPDPGTGKELNYQFCINAYGAVYDILNVPAFGQTSPGYNPKIQFKTHETQSDWYLEGYIDVKDLDPQGRFIDGAVWRANFCWAWPEISWATSGIFWLNHDNMGYFRLNSTAPALQWLDAYPLQEGKLDIKVAMKNMTDSRETYAVKGLVTGETESDVLSSATREITIDPQERKEFRLIGSGGFPGKRGNATLECTSPDGKTVYYQQYLRLDPKNAGALAKTQEAMKRELPMPETMDLGVRYGPLSDAIEAQVDVWYLLRAGTKVDRVHIWLESDAQPGKRLSEADLAHFQKDLALWKTNLPKNAPLGKYMVKAQALSPDGRVISDAKAEFTRIDLKSPSINKPYRARDGHILDWVGTRCGVPTQVPSPWTPIKGNPVTGLSVLNRNIALQGSGLPSQIDAVGEKLLTGPISYVAVVNGKPVELKLGKVGRFTLDKAGLSAGWQGTAAGKSFKLISRAKMEYDGLINYELSIDCPKPTTIDTLYLDIPIRSELATRINSPNSHSEMPAGNGVLWKSKDVVDSELVNTLVSHVWVGNWKCGMTFIADQTRGWYEKQGESLEIISREKDAVHLRVYLVQGPQQVKSTTLTFAILPTPSTQRQSHWREFPDYGKCNYFWAMDWLESRDYEKRPDGLVQWSWDDPTPKELAELKTQDHSNDKRLLLPYTNPWFHYPFVVPWSLVNASPVEPIMLDEWANMPSRWGFVRPVASYRDYMTFNYDWYFRTKHYGGFYVDEAYAAEKDDINMLNGSGWLDRDGNLRGTYHSMDIRELFKRQYVMSEKYSPVHRPFMLNHTSWGQSPQYMSHVTCGVLVENLPIGAGECYLDHMPLITLQFWSGRAWGNFSAVSGVGPDDRSRRYCLGELALHDLCLFNDPGSPKDTIVPIKKTFGIGGDDVTFFGYWEEPKPAKTSDERIKVSAYRRPGSVLLVVCNTDTKNAHKAVVTIDGKVLGLRSGYRADDYETGKPIESTGNAFNVDLGPRDVQYLHLYQQAGDGSAGNGEQPGIHR